MVAFIEISINTPSWPMSKSVSCLHALFYVCFLQDIFENLILKLCQLENTSNENVENNW